MQLKTISRTDLARKTREVVRAVREGHPTLVRSYGEDQVVMLDALDFGLLCGVATWAIAHLEGRPEDQPKVSRVVLDYLDEEISLGKAAETLGISRFELMERFQRLQIPLRLGPSTLAAAESEVEAARLAR